VEWIAKKIQWNSKEEVISILKVWIHNSRAEEYTEEKLEELNKMTDNEILLALRALKKPSVLRKIENKQLNI